MQDGTYYIIYRFIRRLSRCESAFSHAWNLGSCEASDESAQAAQVERSRELTAQIQRWDSRGAQVSWRAGVRG